MSRPEFAQDDARSTLLEQDRGVSVYAPLCGPVTCGFSNKARRNSSGGEAWIEAAPCQEALCGRIVWLKEPLDENGQPHVDNNNPDPELRSHPILGLIIMAGLKPTPGKGYLEGQVYNSKNGKVYDVYLTPNGQTMDVEGCLMKYVCLTQTSTRVK